MKTTEKQVVKDRIQKSMAHVQRLETFVPSCSSTRRITSRYMNGGVPEARPVLAKRRVELRPRQLNLR